MSTVMKGGRVSQVIARSSIALLVLFVASIQGYRFHKDLPGQYVLELYANCTQTPDGWMEVRVLTDLNLGIDIICKDNYTEDVFSFDHINFYFDIVFSGDSSSECVFNKKVDSNVYTMIVETSWGEPESEIRPVVEPYLITCTYDDSIDNVSNIELIADSLIAPKEIQNNQGLQSSSTIDLTMVDIRGDVIVDQIHRGRLVYLAGTSDGSGGEVGLRAVSCDAVGNNGVRYAVLRAGCGDGVIFGQREGFLTQGLSVTSPYFSIFNVKGSNSVLFNCNFTTCSQRCDGSSCTTIGQRIKRSNKGDKYIGESDNIVIELGDNIEEIEIYDYIQDDLDLPINEQFGNSLTNKLDIKDDLDIPVTFQDNDQSFSNEDFEDSNKTDLDDSEDSKYMWWKSPVAILGLAAVLAAILVFGLLCYFRRPKTTSIVYS